MSAPGPTMERDKLEAIRQWSNDPCGAVAAGPLPPGSAEFFQRIEADRYERYAPWMRAVFPFAASRGLRVLEVGCGLGTDLLQFARGGARCVAVDLSPVHLDLAQRRFAREGLAAGLARADCERLPVAAASVDLVYSFGVLHHTPDTAAAVAEIHRALRPGGTAWISLYHRHSAYFWLALLLRRGVLAGELPRRGWRGLLAQVEYREHSDARPLVKTYTRAGVRRLFRAFREVSVTAHHLEREHFSFLGRGLTEAALRRLASRLGWYLVVRATK
jgi:SAM-dependent methyltransferase